MNECPIPKGTACLPTIIFQVCSPSGVGLFRISAKTKLVITGKSQNLIGNAFSFMVLVSTIIAMEKVKLFGKVLSPGVYLNTITFNESYQSSWSCAARDFERRCPPRTQQVMVHPGRLTAGTYKSPIWKGKWSEPNLHEDMFHVNLPGCNCTTETKTTRMSQEVSKWLVNEWVITYL